MAETKEDGIFKDSEQSSLSTTNRGILLPDQALPTPLFIIPVQGPPIYPTLMAPIFVHHPRWIATIEEAVTRGKYIGLMSIRGDELKDSHRLDELYGVGVAVKILKRIKLPDGGIQILVHSIRRFNIKQALSEQPHLLVDPNYLEDQVEKSLEMDALTRAVIGHVKKLSENNALFTEEMRLAMVNAPGPGTIADLVAFALGLSYSDSQEFLELPSVRARFEKLLIYLRREQDVSDMQQRIQGEVNGKLTKMQREFFLKEQLKTIKRELGMEEDGKEKSLRTFRERIEAAGMPDETKKVALEELEKFETLSETSPEYNVSRNYLETLVSLPWSKTTVDQLDLSHAREVLDLEHFGLEKVKDRIIEFLAVRKLRKNPKGSIICLVGPPGVGKTSVGKSIAKTMGRSFYRFSLGGMRDEAEIKGHRRTYVGALPGKIIQGVKRAGTKNCVLMLDEIDKLGASFQGDPASALLEVLDPEQNSQFIDHYLDVSFDLSQVLFIATANTLSTIPAPLLDRMEIIELSGYTLEEKEDIALRFVVPREIESAGLTSKQLKFERAALREMMRDYAREPGLRALQQQVGKIARKAAAKWVLMTEASAVKTYSQVVREGQLEQWLGPKRYYNEAAERITAPGVVVGLAWTALGGDILFIEAQDMPGSGNLKLTGQMGEVMTESAAIAWSYIRKLAHRDLGIDREYFKTRDFHLHIPAGAIPKDGPSAGVTLATAMLSLLQGRVSRQKVAMTGELSLVGKVLPVGGIKEKILAAKRAGVNEVIIPKLNEKDLKEVPAIALKGMTIHFASHVEDVFKVVLGPSVPTRKVVPRVIKTRKVTRGLKNPRDRKKRISVRGQTSRA